jgi:Xaa-Pro aminopeptidase
MTETSAAEYASRRNRARAALRDADIDALLITPGANLRYLTGYTGSPSTERITALVLAADGRAAMLVPVLEHPLVAEYVAAEGDDVVELQAWTETEDSIARLIALLPGPARRVAVDEQMWAGRSLALRAGRPDVDQINAADVMKQLRMRKSADEVAALRRAAAAIDSVHAEMAQWLKPGRTEREIAADIADAIVQAGHVRADFVIVASGPNGASPHADASDRVVAEGAPVVVDIGGPMPDGYNSDSTRTYVLGEPPAEFARSYQVLLSAQRAQCEAVRPGRTADDLDALGRAIIADAGYGELFVHRTGHGIGLEVHEHPYIVEGNELELAEGMAFSVEPGIYHPGRYGARIEDIVVCTASGGERLNQRPRELGVLPC